MKDRKSYFILRWDSKLFGYKVAQIVNGIEAQHLKKILEDAHKENVRLIYWFVDPKDSSRKNAAKRNHGLLTSVKVTYLLHLPKTIGKGSKRNNIFQFKGKNITKEMRLLALQCGIFSRFAMDRHFIHHEYDKLYALWMRRSVNGAIAFAVLVYRDQQKKVRGVITLETKKETGHIVLFVVDENFRGKSVGKKLMMEALRVFYRKGLNNIIVTTQEKNVIARRFYEKFGFKEVTSEATYHFWL